MRAKFDYNREILRELRETAYQARTKEYRKEYDQRPYVKAKKRKYENRPENRARKKEYNRRYRMMKIMERGKKHD